MTEGGAATTYDEEEAKAEGFSLASHTAQTLAVASLAKVQAAQVFEAGASELWVGRVRRLSGIKT